MGSSRGSPLLREWNLTSLLGTLSRGIASPLTDRYKYRHISATDFLFDRVKNFGEIRDLHMATNHRGRTICAVNLHLYLASASSTGESESKSKPMNKTTSAA